MREPLHVVGQQIDDDIVKTDASVRIGLDDVEDETRLSGLNDDPGFLEQFSLCGLLQRFPISTLPPGMAQLTWPVAARAGRAIRGRP